MNPTLKEFYSQDASIKSLSKDRQIQLFDDWAEKKELHIRLTFKERLGTKWLSRIYIVLAVIYLAVYFLNIDRIYSPSILIGFSLINLLLRQEIPSLYRIDQGGVI